VNRAHVRSSCAALSLAKVYHSIRLPLEAHDVLARAARRLFGDTGVSRVRGSAKMCQLFKRAGSGLSRPTARLPFTVSCFW
jgi:hypothetical protein